MTSFEIDPSAAIGAVDLTVRDIEMSTSFYRDVIGLTVLEARDGKVSFGADTGGRPLLRIAADPYAQPKPHFSTGLYHFAILVPTRRDLAFALKRIIDHKWGLTGASDHWVSEALYLDDPDGNGIEVYRDRPREMWATRPDGAKMVTERLHMGSLMEELDDHKAVPVSMPPGTVIGHVHLQVSDLDASERFYSDILGFDKFFAMPSALFLGAGGYHHHLGLNTWAGEGAPAPPKNSLGLRHYEILLPNRRAVDVVVKRLEDAGIAVERDNGECRLHDPSGNALRLALR